MPFDKDSGWTEPDIIINGYTLSFAECMSVRVAINSFRIALSSRSMREGIGERLADGYDSHLLNVEKVMLGYYGK